MCAAWRTAFWNVAGLPRIKSINSSSVAGPSLILNSYVVLERLGEGGTGQVFKARHQHMNRIVALKLIRHDLVADKEVVVRFQREIQLASQLTDPHVVHAYDAGPIGNTYFLAMECVEGIDLLKLVKQNGRLPVAQAIDYVRQAALGLQHIHERSLVHRDIKPSNLLVTGLSGGSAACAVPVDGGPGPSAWGLLKILDLGLARLQRPVDSEATGNVTTSDTMAMGTLDYMAPEQAIDFHRTDIRADVYSLGCTFYYLLTGQPPFPGGTAAQKLLRHQQMEPAAVETLCSGLPPALPPILPDDGQAPGRPLSTAARSRAHPGRPPGIAHAANRGRHQHRIAPSAGPANCCPSSKACPCHR